MFCLFELIPNTLSDLRSSRADSECLSGEHLQAEDRSENTDLMPQGSQRLVEQQVT